MTHEEFQRKLEAIPNLELAEKAQSALSKLCSTGGTSFTMTVPPRLDDTDIILSEVIKRFELLHQLSYANNIIDYIENEAEIAIPIDAFFNKDNSHITKNEYGIILVKTLCQELRDKFISPITNKNK